MQLKRNLHSNHELRIPRIFASAFGSTYGRYFDYYVPPGYSIREISCYMPSITSRLFRLTSNSRDQTVLTKSLEKFRKYVDTNVWRDLWFLKLSYFNKYSFNHF